MEAEAVEAMAVVEATAEADEAASYYSAYGAVLMAELLHVTRSFL